MPKYRGLKDIYINPPTDGTLDAPRGQISRGGGELFTTIVNHISSSGTELGIEMIAAKFGTNGLGLGYWDTPSRAGHGAFACFRFHSASAGKFDCMIYIATGSNVSMSPMNVGGYTTTWQAAQTGNNVANLGISISWHPSGSNVTQSDGPWNGSYDLTNATIGTPVWKVNSEGKGGFWPRANGIAGTYSGSRNYMFPITPDIGQSGATSNPSRSQFVISEESIFSAVDYNGINGNQFLMYFGPFLPRSGAYYESYYFGFHSNEGQNPFGAFYGTTLGTTTNPTHNTAYDGCISVPTLTSGARNMAFVVPGVDQNIGFNRHISSGSGGVWEKFPVWVAVADSAMPNFYGILGRAKQFGYGFGMNANTVSDVSSSVALGVAGSPNSAKILLPWSGSAPGLTSTGRAGVVMNWDE